MKVSKNFYLQELVPKKIYDKYNIKSMWFIDPRLIYQLQIIRSYFDAEVYVNTWLQGGTKELRGYRDPGCKTGAYRSQHKAGRAADIVVKGVPSIEVQAKIIKWAEGYGDNSDKDFKFLGAIKTGTIGYTHIDLRQRTGDNILIFN